MIYSQQLLQFKQKTRNYIRILHTTTTKANPFKNYDLQYTEFSTENKRSEITPKFYTHQQQKQKPFKIMIYNTQKIILGQSTLKSHSTSLTQIILGETERTFKNTLYNSYSRQKQKFEAYQ